MKPSQSTNAKIFGLFKKREVKTANLDEVLKQCGEKPYSISDSFMNMEKYTFAERRLPSHYYELPTEIRRELYLSGVLKR